MVGAPCQCLHRPVASGVKRAPLVGGPPGSSHVCQAPQRWQDCIPRGQEVPAWSWWSAGPSCRGCPGVPQPWGPSLCGFQEVVLFPHLPWRVGSPSHLIQTIPATEGSGSWRPVEQGGEGRGLAGGGRGAGVPGGRFPATRRGAHPGRTAEVGRDPRAPRAGWRTRHPPAQLRTVLRPRPVWGTMTGSLSLARRSDHRERRPASWAGRALPGTGGHPGGREGGH